MLPLTSVVVCYQILGNSVANFQSAKNVHLPMTGLYTYPPPYDVLPLQFLRHPSHHGDERDELGVCPAEGVHRVGQDQTHHGGPCDLPQTTHQSRQG